MNYNSKITLVTSTIGHYHITIVIDDKLLLLDRFIDYKLLIQEFYVIYVMMRFLRDKTLKNYSM